MNSSNPVLALLVHLTGYFPNRRLETSLRKSRETQETLLRSIVRRNRETEFGKRFGFGDIRSVSEFQHRVPIQDYNLLAEDIGRIRNGEDNILYPATDTLHMFGLTSGSTGTPKTIPITRRYIERFRQTYSIWSTRILRDHPGLADGKYLAMYSDWQESFTPRGVPCGAVTGLLASLQPPWIRKRMAVPPAASKIPDPAIKELTVLHHALCHETALWTSANPSSLLRLAVRLEENLETLIRNLSDGAFGHLRDLPEEYRSHPDFRPNPHRAKILEKRICLGENTFPPTLWPGLQALSCWMGGPLSPYLEALRQRFPGIPIRDPGLMASEGRFTIPVEDNTASGFPDLSSLFFEFFPAEEDACVPVGEAVPLLRSHEVEVGKRYFLIFACDWGLYRYHIDDIVEVTARIGEVPLLRFVRKGSGFSSITGEKLSEDQVVSAIESLPAEFRSRHGDLVVAPIWGDPPGYLLLIEEEEGWSDAAYARVAAQMEERLVELNCEYRSKRKSGRLAPLKAALLPSGSFARLKKEEVERAGGRSEQYKLKRIRGDLEFASRLGDYRLVEPKLSEKDPV